MNTLLATTLTPGKPRPRALPEPSVPSRNRPARATRTLLTSLVRRTRESKLLRYEPSPPFRRNGRDQTVPHFVFTGPPAGGETIRLGLFGAIHGDEAEGALALAAFLEDLQAQPDLAAGYQLHIYPVCNPEGFAAGTRQVPSGKDLNREFWNGSAEPEVWWLEHELITRRFHGLISLHGDDTAEGFYAYARGALFSESLARPALKAASQFLPLDRRPKIDGFVAREGLLTECFGGVLSAPPAGLEPIPFEIILEAPQSVSPALQVRAGKVALLAILQAYRVFLAYSPNI